MKKQVLNNKGFAITAVMYSLLVLFLLLIMGLLSILATRKITLDKLKKDIMSELNGEVSAPEEKGNLISTLLTQYKDTNTTGLLKEGDSYYYKGIDTEVTNNFVWHEGHLWRVMQINNDNTVTMITQQPITAISPTSDVWVSREGYEVSFVNNWLNNVFYNSINDKNKMKQNSFNIGVFSNVSEITTTQYVGLLDEVQRSKAGGANSYLDKSDYWLGNRFDSITIRGEGDSGFFDDNDGRSPTSALGVRPVIKISDLTITSGNGTLSDPFRESSKTTNTSNVKVGEYISVPGSSTYCSTVTSGRCLFRVVSKDSDSVKVILNGLLPTESAFGSTTTFSASSTINTQLTNFVNSISTKYRYSGNKIFNIGMYGGGLNYTTVSNTTYNGNVGLPVVGEMFSGNDIDVTTGAKTFVNVAVIENQTVSDRFWTINASNSTTMHGVSNGGLRSGVPTNAYGVRPVMFLNLGTSSDLTFTVGDGTAENPYKLGN